MSQENVEVVRRGFAAFAARDWAALAEVWHPEIEYETLETDPDSATYRGVHDITKMFDALAAPFSKFRVQADEIRDLGPDRVLAVERAAGGGLKGSDAEAWIEQVWFRLITLKDGRIWRVKEFATRDKALEAAGLRE
jgi:ketosteroid isomerase-like protein